MIRKLVVMGLIGSGAAAYMGFAPAPPKDEAVLAHFARHKAQFDKMHVELCATRKYFTLVDADEGSQGRLAPAKRERYLGQLRKLNVKGVSVYPEFSNKGAKAGCRVSFYLFSSTNAYGPGLDKSGMDKQIEYGTPAKDAIKADNLDAVNFGDRPGIYARRIEGKWWLTLDYDHSRYATSLLSALKSRFMG